MSIRPLLALLLFSMLTTGCQVVDATREMTRQSVSMFTPRGFDERDATEESGDEWGEVGKEARGDRVIERDPDQWWRKHVMSSKARSVEGNLGFQ
jgi:hypothetical protein